MTINIMVIDSAVRIRDFKEITALQYVYPKKFKFVFVIGSKGIGNKLDGVKVIKVKTKHPVNRLVKICKEENIDLIHSHNFPDTYGYWAMLVKKRLGIPFVHECHDIAYPNTPKPLLTLERTVMKSANSIITVSGGMKDYLHKKYHIGNKCIVIYPFPNKRYLPKIPWNVQRRYTRGVYQGGINNSFLKGSKYNHRYYKDIFRSLNNQGLSIDVYPQHGFRGYDLPKVKVHKRINGASKLYKAISNYDFAFIGYNNTKAPFLDFAAPNKLFEGISAGIPVLAQDYSTIAKFVKKNKLGVVINRNTLKLPKNFHKQMANAKRNSMKLRYSFTMERQAPELLKLYQGLI